MAGDGGGNAGVVDAPDDAAAAAFAERLLNSALVGAMREVVAEGALGEAVGQDEHEDAGEGTMGAW